MDGESSPRASRMPNASDTIKYERKYHVEILGGFSLESRSDLAMPSEIHAVYKPVMPETRRDVHSQRPYVYNLPLPVVH